MALLGYLAHRFNSFPGDGPISQWLQGIDLPFFSWLMEAVSSLGSNFLTVVTVLSLVLWLWFLGRRLEAIFIIVLPSVAGILNYWLKLLVDRPRPGDELLGGGLSFPSGHAVYAVVLFGFLYYLVPRLAGQPLVIRVVQPALVLLILLMGASRVYLGAHWPSDILGSFLFGGLLLALAISLYNNQAKGGKRKLGTKNA